MSESLPRRREPAPPRRRWFQFGLRELFWLTLVFAALLFGIRERWERNDIEARYESTVLDTKTVIEFVGLHPLSDMLDYFSQKHDGFRWRFDDAAFASVGMRRPGKLMFNNIAAGLPLRDALDQILEPHGLSYRFERGEVVITPQQPTRQ